MRNLIIMFFFILMACRNNGNETDQQKVNKEQQRREVTEKLYAYADSFNRIELALVALQEQLDADTHAVALTKELNQKKQTLMAEIEDLNKRGKLSDEEFEVFLQGLEISPEE